MRKPKRGRPATGKGIPVYVRFQKPLMRAVDEWLGAHPAAHSRADAIRKLVEIGLTTSQNAERAPRNRSNAAEAPTSQRQRSRVVR
jgi:hypothetical protein